MAWKKHAARDATAWSLVRRQHGVVARRQLMAFGYTRREIEQRLHNGRLHYISHGVYAVGRRELTPHGRWMAAVLACGDGAVLSHRSAAELWGIGYEDGKRIDVTIRRKSKITRKGIKVRARPSLDTKSVVVRHGIPVTSPVQTLIDLATELKIMRLERAVNEADKLDLVDPEALREALDSYVGMPGVKTPRTMLDRHTFRLSDSDLEVLFRPLALAAGLPLPFSKHRVLGYEVDFWFPNDGLVVETDGLRYHRTASQQAQAARRDQKHTASGLRVLRFTHWQIAYEPDEVTDVLLRMRRHLHRSVSTS
jgi:very-short-patch-repair endonuclease